GAPARLGRPIPRHRARAAVRGGARTDGALPAARAPVPDRDRDRQPAQAGERRPGRSVRRPAGSDARPNDEGRPGGRPSKPELDLIDGGTEALATATGAGPRERGPDASLTPAGGTSSD